VLNSGLLETAIGLVLIYMILSFLSTGINEWIATLTQRRSEFLEQGVKRLLGSELGQSLYQHPLLLALRRHTRRGDRRPSYIPAGTFSKVVLALLPSIGSGGSGRAVEVMIKDIDNKQVQESLLTLWADAGQQLDKFKAEIEQWFNDTMDRVSGWYKRRTQLVTFVVAVGVAVTLNADTIRIATTLWTNPTLRAALVVQAEQAVQQHDSNPPETTIPTVKESLKQVQSLPLPLGWTSANKVDSATNREDPRAAPDSFWEILIKVLGLFITACALTIGAPFWFDILKKFINIRGAGKPSDTKQ